MWDTQDISGDDIFKTHSINPVLHWRIFYTFGIQNSKSDLLPEFTYRKYVLVTLKYQAKPGSASVATSESPVDYKNKSFFCFFQDIPSFLNLFLSVKKRFSAWNGGEGYPAKWEIMKYIRMEGRKKVVPTFM